MKCTSALVAILMLFISACGTDSPGSMIIGGETDTGKDEGTVDVGTDVTPDTGDVGSDTNEPTVCTTSDDCESPQVCALVADGFQCVDPEGGATGAACTTGAECASRICVNQMCAAPCSGESDCPAGFECESSEVPTDNGTLALNVCVEEAKPCLSNTDCTDPEVCVLDGGTLLCGAPVGNGDIGSACAADSECKNGFCIDDICSAPCERPSDCADDGSFVCEPKMVPSGNDMIEINACAVRPPDACLSDSECAGDARCVATKSATDVEFACGTPNAGGAELGVACSADADCAQNLCVDDVCVGPCQSNGDCSAAADYTCELVTIDLGGATDTAQICAPPVECDQPADCAANETCYIRPGQAGTVDLLCRAPNVGGGSLNQVCASALECGANYCLETRFRDVCTNACVDDNDCSQPGYTCQATDVNGTSVDLCAPQTPTACTSNDDCATGTVCAVIVDAAATGLESVCVPATGGDAAGVACQNDGDCASLVCNNGACGAPCVDAGDCPSGTLCTNETVTKQSQTGSFDICTVPVDVQCTDNSDCTDGVRICGDLRLVNNVLTPFCGFPNAGGAQLGSSCAQNSDCRENVCLAGLSNECSVVCGGDADCGTGQGCTTFSDIGFCNTTCSDNSDCGAGQTCTLNGDSQDNDLDQICLVTSGTKLLGDVCADGSECQSGICLQTVLFNTTACTTDAQCAMGETCSCPVGQPNCTTGKMCATTTNACTNLCNDNTDCTGGAAGNVLTSCSTNTVVTLPDGSGTKTVATCAQP